MYASAVPNEHLEWVIYLESQRMRHVRFDEAAVDLERTSVISEEQQYRNSPAYVLDEHVLRRAALVAHPYGSPIMGRMSDLLGVTAPDLERLYREHYAPNNAILAIVGRFDETAAIALVRKYLRRDAGRRALDGAAHRRARSARPAPRDDARVGRRRAPAGARALARRE